MEFERVITERSSVKKYDPSREVEKEKLLRILEAGRVAPTAKNLQEQHIYVAQGEALKKIDEVTRCRYGAPVVLIVCFDKNNVYTYPEGVAQSGVEDATIVATHMMLAAQNEGLGSCWLNCVYLDRVKELFNIPSNEEVVMLLDIGYPHPEALMNPNHGKRKPLEETVTWLK